MGADEALGSDADAFVLIVDDDATIRLLFERALTRAGFEVISAPDGPSALELFESEPVSVVLLDSQMPEMSGLEVLEKIRDHPLGRTVPVIFVTGVDELDARVRGLEAGADDYVTKPVEVPELVARVRTQVRRGAVWSGSVAALERRLDAVVLLRSIRHGSDANAIADAVCRELLGHGGVAAVGIAVFHGGRTAVSLAGSGAWAGWFSPGEPLAPALARRLIGAVAQGPRMERGSARRDEADELTLPAAALGRFDVALAPISGRREPLGLLALAVDPDGELAGGDSALASAIDFAAVLSALLATDLEHEAASERSRSDLRHLLDTRAFTPLYQPVVDLGSGAMVGVEALTRWDDGVRPDLRFVEAHTIGLGIEAESAAIVEILRAPPPLADDVWLSLNVSPAMVLSGALGPLVADAVRSLVLELTEHDEVHDYPALRAALDQTPQLAVAVDDAGAGYASLRHVLDLKPDFVKLDINWVHDIHADPARQALTTAMVGFAAEMDIRVIAEGIETADERDALVGLGVKLGQGYLYSRPVPAEDLPDLGVAASG